MRSFAHEAGTNNTEIEEILLIMGLYGTKYVINDVMKMDLRPPDCHCYVCVYMTDKGQEWKGDAKHIYFRRCRRRALGHYLKKLHGGWLNEINWLKGTRKRQSGNTEVNRLNSNNNPVRMYIQLVFCPILCKCYDVEHAI